MVNPICDYYNYENLMINPSIDHPKLSNIHESNVFSWSTFITRTVSPVLKPFPYTKSILEELMELGRVYRSTQKNKSVDLRVCRGKSGTNQRKDVHRLGRSKGLPTSLSRQVAPVLPVAPPMLWVRAASRAQRWDLLGLRILYGSFGISDCGLRSRPYVSS